MEGCDRFSRPVGLSITEDSYLFYSGWGICFTTLITLIAAMYAVEKLFI